MSHMHVIPSSLYESMLCRDVNSSFKVQVVQSLLNLMITCIYTKLSAIGQSFTKHLMYKVFQESTAW